MCRVSNKKWKVATWTNVQIVWRVIVMCMMLIEHSERGHISCAKH